MILQKKKEYFITIGDSFTFGVNVSTDHNWTEIQEDCINMERTCSRAQKYEVINLGVGGYDTSYELERYRLRGQKYNPDLVVWLVTDLQRITEEIIPLSDKVDESLDENKNREKGIFYEAWRRALVQIVNKYGKKELINFKLSKFKEFREKYYISKPLLFMTFWEDLKRLGNKSIYYSDIETWQDKTNLLHDSHFNNIGHKKFAQEVFNAFDKNKLLPCD